MFDGKILPSNTKLVGVDSDLLQYGEFVYIDMRAFSGKVYFFSYYYEQLIDTLKMLDIDVGIELSQDVLKGDIFDLLQKNRLYLGAKIHLVVFRNQANKSPHVLLRSEIANNAFEININGYHAELNLSNKVPTNLYAKYPIGGYSPLFKILKEELKLVDKKHLITNELGDVIQLSDANIFAIKSDTLFSPSIDHGCTVDVLRGILVELALKLNYKVFDDCILKPKNLLEMDEIFAINTLGGIKWISAFGERRYANKVSKKILEEINQLALQSIGR